MSRRWCRVKPADEQVLVPLRCACPECGRAMRIRYSNHRAIVSLRGLVRLRLKIRRCEDGNCGEHKIPWGVGGWPVLVQASRVEVIRNLVFGKPMRVQIQLRIV